MIGEASTLLKKLWGGAGDKIQPTLSIEFDA